MFGFGNNLLYDGKAIYYLYTNALLFIVLAICSTPIIGSRIKRLKDSLKFRGNIIIPIIFMVILFICTAYLVDESYNPFLYFRF